MNDTHVKYLDFMSHLHGVALHLVDRFTFDKKHPWHRGLVMFYGTLLELLGSTCVLVREGIGVGIPILLRSAVEAYLDLENLAKDKMYGCHLRATEQKEWIKIICEAKKEENPFLSGIAVAPNLDETLSKWESELANLKKNGYNPLRQEEKFDKANLGSVYRSAYNFLCCHTHNNLRALNFRHMNISEDEADFNIEYYAPFDMKRFIPYLDYLCGIIVSSTEIIHRVLNTGAQEDINNLKDQLDALRKQLQTEQALLANPEGSADTPSGAHDE